MKKYLAVIIAAFMTIFLTFAATSCGKSETESKDSVSSVTPIDGLEVKAKKTDVYLALEDVETFNYASLFEIYVGGVKKAVMGDYINKSQMKKQLGTYEVSCSYGGQTAVCNVTVVAEREVFIEALTTKISVKDSEIRTYDYTKHFRVLINGNEAEVKPEYLDLTALSPEPDTYVITCNYSGATAKLWVEVIETPFFAAAYESDVYVYVGSVEKLDLKSLFGISLYNEEVEVTDDMITGEVKPVLGDYEINLAIGSRKAKTTVHVVDRHIIKIGTAYSELDFSVEEAKTYDYSSDFYIFEDGERVDVKSSGVSLDKSGLNNPVVGKSYEVKLTYASADGKGNASKTIKVNVKEVGAIKVNVVNAEVFGNENVDVTKLFEVTKNGKVIPVTPDMVSGTIDFSESDSCKITLTYESVVKVATVKKITGVLIKCPRGEVISVKKGTDKNSYDFAGDFEVYINGIRFYGIDAFIDTSSVNFNVIGKYEATLNVLYNDANVGRLNPKFAAAKSKTITYNVMPKVYELGYKADVVELEDGVTEYNPLDNVELYVDGYEQSFTTNRGSVNSLTTYYVVKTAPDLTKSGEQTIEIELYAGGLDYAPITATYKLVVKKGAVVYAEDTTVFTGDTLYTPDLFTVFDNGTPVKVTLDMITGRIDVDTPGVYEVELNYKGVRRSSTVFVLSSDLLGTYKTADKTIEAELVEDDEGQVVDEEKPSVAVGDMVIGHNAAIDVHGVSATNLEFKDYGFDFAISNNRHKAIINDGIAVLIPYNELRMSYYDDRRPLVYFKSEVWTIADTIEAHSSSEKKSVYSNGYSGICSIYLYKVKNVASGEFKWFAIKVKLESYMDSNYNYSTEYGFADVSANLTSKSVGESETVAIGEAGYQIKIVSRGVATFNQQAAGQPFENRTFSGTVNGLEATLTIGSGKASSLTTSGGKIYSLGQYDATDMKYEASSLKYKTFTTYGLKVETFNKKNSTTEVTYVAKFNVNEEDNEEKRVTLTPFSYKFKLNLENGTFELLEKDEYFGLFRCADGKLIFLDGYGKGVLGLTDALSGHFGFEYSVKGNKITLAYYDKNRELSAAQATLLADEFKNVLTAEDMGDEVAKGVQFENAHITNGALVTIERTVFHKGEKTDDILSAIKIVGKTGEYTAAQKEATFTYNSKKYTVVDTGKVARSLSVAGFYYVSVNLKNDDGTLSTKVFAIQILDEIFETGKGFARDYGESISKLTSFTMNTFGEVEFVYEGVKYTGLAHANADGTKLYVTVNAIGHDSVKLTGAVDSNGLLSLYGVANGIILSEYYCVGTVRYAGNGEILIRSFQTTSGNVFFISSSLPVLGEKIEITTKSGEKVSSINSGDVLKFAYNGKEYVVKIVNLNDDKTGLSVSDMLDGTYETDDGSNTLVLDGFGKATLGNVTCDYTVSDKSDNRAKLVLTNSAGQIKMVTIGIGGAMKGKFTDNGAPSERILRGKTYYTDISVGGYEGGTARVSLIFGTDGNVKVGFTYSDSQYNTPSYVGNGTFTVSGKTVTISVNGCKLEMAVSDVWTANTLMVKNVVESENYDDEYGPISNRLFKLA